MRNFKAFYANWQGTMCRLEEAIFGADVEAVYDHKNKLEDDFHLHHEEYLQSAQCQGCLTDFEALLNAYPELDSIGYSDCPLYDDYDN